MARRRSENNAEDVEMDMTPMLDVVFILLIFFIVTAVFVKEPGVDVTKPFWAPDLVTSKPSIMVGVSDESVVWINKNPVPMSGVKAELAKMKAENPKAEGVIRGDKKADIGVVLDIQDMFTEVGISVEISVEN
ncbi:Biopolymer transport protein ExbD/TolR [hydrothermal vent metagenome]|uniref:Biopolymer transport protein ExbD/TolR n=1 Tax=hydrothermal vent metagenome TaxID=652676 RepID=A0A3B0S2A2_9ZZZZ